MELRRIKKANLEFISHFPATLPTMVWHFSSSVPKGAIELPPDYWTCMFRHLEDVAAGQKICFSEESAGCPGASCYFGFSQPGENAGGFLSTKEKFKEKLAYGKAFYRQVQASKPAKKYLVLSPLEQADIDAAIEVVNFWANPLSLSGLVTLANFDSPENNNVTIPFAAGCQSMWTIPYNEKGKKYPKATVGAMDPAMRKYITPDTLLFSVPANRFYDMAQNIMKSFAGDRQWLELIGKGPML